VDIGIYFFINAMTTVSAVVSLYSPNTTLASVAVLNMDDAGDTAPAAAMAMLIVLTAGVVRPAAHGFEPLAAPVHPGMAATKAVNGLLPDFGDITACGGLTAMMILCGFG
jgi:hypothetical protein